MSEHEIEVSPYLPPPPVNGIRQVTTINVTNGGAEVEIPLYSTRPAHMLDLHTGEPIDTWKQHEGGVK